MNVLWMLSPGAESFTPGMPVPPCFVPSDAIVAAAARCGLELCIMPVLDPELDVPTPHEELVARRWLKILFADAADQN
jgi:hypothetical protein